MGIEDLIKNIDNKIAELNKNEENEIVPKVDNNKKRRFRVDLENIVEFRNLTQWCLDLKNYWINKNIKGILGLFDDNVVYFETPDKLIKTAELEKIWSEIYNQNIIFLNYEVIDMFKKHNFVDFKLETDKGIVNMTYVFVLNNENKCVYFMQQYEIKNK